MADEPVRMDLDTIREAVEIATTRMPWSSEHFATIMTAMVLDVPALIAEVERLRRELGASRQASKALERQSRRRKETADSYQRIAIMHASQRDKLRAENERLCALIANAASVALSREVAE